MPTPSPFADADAPSQAAGGSTVEALYRAALGPVQQARYLALFERFDQAGRAPVGWNLGASLATLNWMLLHHLWTAALVYVALVEGLALLIFGVGRPLLHWPEQLEWALIAAFALFAIALPGLFGDALLYSEIRKRMARALVAAHSIPEACDLLARQASSWRRLGVIAVANGALFLAIAAAWLWVPEGAGHASSPSEAQVAFGTVQSAAKSALPASAAPAAAAAAPATASLATPASAPSRPGSDASATAAP
ncbi:MAG: sporulation protein, partial [Burkholderiaceae bacterium]|nr:sporulation protein [Burkholderiaceae bacterium]